MRQVFISYSSKDLAQAQAVRNVLEQNGITCWMAPADIPGGSNYTKEIPIAIKGCQAFVLMLSDNAQHSVWVLKELDSAVNAGKIILPFQIEDVPLSDEFNFLLTGAQRYAAYQRKSDAMKLLVQRIQAIIATDTPPQADPEPQPEPEPKQTKPKQTMDAVFNQYFGSQAKQTPPKKTPPKTGENTGIHSTNACPACGSSDVTEFPNKIEPRGFREWLTRILNVVIFGYLGAIIGVIPFAVLMAVDYSDDFYLIGLIGWVVGVVLGIRWGIKQSNKQITRRRIRSHTKVAECRCNTCQKRFQVAATDGTPGK